MPTTARRGTVLIIVAGISAMLMALALTFVMRMRSSAEESALVLREMQARIMLVAGCAYVQECSRIGWDTSTDEFHQEAYGWIDVRDGSLGPKRKQRAGDGTVRWVPVYDPSPREDGDGDGRAERPAWPALGSVARCPMYRWQRPPYALSPQVAYNPIPTDERENDAVFGRALLHKPDPLPAVDDEAAFNAGDPRPRVDSTGLSWFRVLRDMPAEFIITCGAGATQGFRDWREVVGAGQTDLFGNDPALFAVLRQQEVITWYRVEWSSAVLAPDYRLVMADQNVMNTNDYTPAPFGPDTPAKYAAKLYKWPVVATQVDQCWTTPMNASNGAFLQAGRSQHSQSAPKNFAGTIRMVQRLRHQPTYW